MKEHKNKEKSKNKNKSKDESNVSNVSNISNVSNVSNVKFNDTSFDFINENISEFNIDSNDNTPRGIISDITNDIIQYISNIVYEPTNTKKIKHVFSYLIKCLLEHIYIYLYTIMALLIIIFIMNCSQFYYIIKKS
jgi:hypothetical protein